MRDLWRVRTSEARSAPRETKDCTATIEIEPQNSDVYVNSEVHYLKIQREINIEAVISFD
jgi:hypothetical protein